MRRLLWIAVGVGVGTVGVWRAKRVVRRIAPASLAEDLAGLGEAVRDFADQVREGMLEREWELREALGLGESDPQAPDRENPGDIIGVVMDAGMADGPRRGVRWPLA
jgi:hypothetical protein